MTSDHSRPLTLADVAARSESLHDFGLHLRDWLHALRRISSRNRLAVTIAEAPSRLSRLFPEGQVADAWLAAYAEHLAHNARIDPPAWAFVPWRTLQNPDFAIGAESTGLRRLALAQSPLAFKRRNIFTTAVDLPLRLRAGRPAKSVAEKRQANAERQRRFRKARAEELQQLRQFARIQTRSASKPNTRSSH